MTVNNNFFYDNSLSVYENDHRSDKDLVLSNLEIWKRDYYEKINRMLNADSEFIFTKADTFLNTLHSSMNSFSSPMPTDITEEFINIILSKEPFVDKIISIHSCEADKLLKSKVNTIIDFLFSNKKLISSKEEESGLFSLIKSLFINNRNFSDVSMETDLGNFTILVMEGIISLPMGVIFAAPRNSSNRLDTHLIKESKDSYEIYCKEISPQNSIVMKSEFEIKNSLLDYPSISCEKCLKHVKKGNFIRSSLGVESTLDLLMEEITNNFILTENSTSGISDLIQTKRKEVFVDVVRQAAGEVPLNNIREYFRSNLSGGSRFSLNGRNSDIIKDLFGEAKNMGILEDWRMRALSREIMAGIHSR